MYKTRFLCKIQIIFILRWLSHITLTIWKRYVKIGSSHLDVISLKIPIHCYRSTGQPIREIHPIRRKIDSRLRTRRAEQGKAAWRRWGGVINGTESFHNLQFSHLSADPDQFLIPVLLYRVNLDRINLGSNSLALHLENNHLSAFSVFRRSFDLMFCIP